MKKEKENKEEVEFDFWAELLNKTLVCPRSVIKGDIMKQGTDAIVKCDGTDHVVVEPVINNDTTAGYFLRCKTCGQEFFVFTGGKDYCSEDIYVKQKYKNTYTNGDWNKIPDKPEYKTLRNRLRVLDEFDISPSKAKLKRILRNIGMSKEYYELWNL